jgi:MSHA pilin protein MshA
MKQPSSGFTLIELVTVIVILGALAAVATPRFVDLQQEADKAAIDGIAGGLASGASVNFAGCAAVDHSSGKDQCEQVTTCTDVKNDTLQTSLPADISVTNNGFNSTSNNGESGECVVTDTAASVSTTFQAIRAGD